MRAFSQIPASVYEPYQCAVNYWQEARLEHRKARELLFEVKRCVAFDLQHESVLRQEREAYAFEKLLADMKEEVRGAIGALWEYIPVLEASEILSDFVLFRGTILRRLILEPKNLDVLPQGRAQLLDIEGMGSIDSDMPAITEWSESFDMALKYAKDGYACDGIQGSKRNDPVVLALTSGQLRECQRKDNVYPAPDKTTISPKSLYQGDVGIFRVV